jgi:hypothetical protein
MTAYTPIPAGPTSYSAPKPVQQADITPVDPLSPETTVYWDQSTGAQEPGAGGPVVAWRVYYDNSVSGLATETVQGAIDLLDNALDNITGASASLDARVDVLEVEMDTAQADIIALQGRVTTVESNITNLQAADTNLQGQIDTLDTRLTTAEGSITSLGTRMDAVEAKNTQQDGRLDTAESSITSLDTRLDTAEASIVTLQGKTNQATEATAGIAEIATTAEVTAGADDLRFVTPLKLAQRLTAFTVNAASETVAGIAEIATTAEVTAGTDDARIVSPLKLAQRLAALPGASAASETVAGIAEIATQAEANAGADDARILTPLKLRNFTGMIAGPVGIGTAPLAATVFSVAAPADAHVRQNIRATGAGNAAMLGLITTDRAYTVHVQSGYFQIVDDTAGAARLLIDSTGRVGVGAVPAVKFHVYDAAFASIVVETAAAAQARIDLKNTVRNYSIIGNSDQSFQIYDLTAAKVRVAILSNGNMGIGADGGSTVYPLELRPGAGIDAWYTATTPDVARAAGFAFRNAGRFYGLFVDGASNNLTISDFSSGAVRLAIDPNGAWTVKPRNDGYCTLAVQGTTNPAILYLQNNIRSYEIQTDNGGSLIFKDGSAGANRMYCTAAGDWTITSTLYLAGGLMGGEGNAGRLKCYNTNNYITFQWNGTNLYGRIDNGGAVVLLG